MSSVATRAYLKHKDPHEITLDGKKAHIPTGMKVAIRASLDKHHKRHNYDDMSLGAMQNHAEGGDHFINNHYRILTQDHEHPNHFHSNHEQGIFPPLIDHDHEKHEWTHIGHARDIQPGEFRHLTKTKEHPKGISHKDFTESLNRFHERQNGRHHESGTPNQYDKHLDHVDQHPLIKKFQDYHGNTGHPTYDYQQKKNLGVWEHPDGSKHIVARDHGFNSDVMHANQRARRSQAHAGGYNRQ